MITIQTPETWPKSGARPARYRRRPGVGKPAAVLTAAEHLSRQWYRLTRMLDDHDPTHEIGAAWAVKERLRMLLAEHEPSKIRRRLADFYGAAIDARQLEATRLAEQSRHVGATYGRQYLRPTGRQRHLVMN